MHTNTNETYDVWPEQNDQTRRFKQHIWMRHGAEICVDQPTWERTVLLSAVSSMLRSAELLGGETCCQHRSAGALLSDAGAVSGRPTEVDVFRGEGVQGRAIAEAAWEPYRSTATGRPTAHNLRSSTGARSGGVVNARWMDFSPGGGGGVSALS